MRLNGSLDDEDLSVQMKVASSVGQVFGSSELEVFGPDGVIIVDKSLNRSRSKAWCMGAPRLLSGSGIVSSSVL